VELVSVLRFFCWICDEAPQECGHIEKQLGAIRRRLRLLALAFGSNDLAIEFYVRDRTDDGNAAAPST
jgi:hypothetical protein